MKKQVKKGAKVFVTGSCRGEACTLCQVHTALLGFLPETEGDIHIGHGAPLPPNIVDIEGTPIRPGKVPIKVNNSPFCPSSNNGAFAKMYAEITEERGYLIFRGIRCE